MIVVDLTGGWDSATHHPIHVAEVVALLIAIFEKQAKPLVFLGKCHPKVEIESLL